MRPLRFLSSFAACILWFGPAGAHARLERSTPAVGATLSQIPAAVTIYFDSELEPVFSKLIVNNEQGEKVSAGDGAVSPDNHKMLVTKVAVAGKGTYHVFWDVVSHDGHRVKGDYVFTVK